MSILDIIIIVLIGLGFFAGFQRGIIKQGVLTVGTSLVVFFAFLLKNPLSMFMYQHFPFFTSGILKNYSILNILVYELIAFFILVAIFGLILAIVVKLSGVVERMVRATVILALPSRILGGLLGAIEVYIYTFIILFIITMPIFSVSKTDFVTKSKLKDGILKNTILLSHFSNDVNNSVTEINDLLKSKNKLGTEEFNCKALNVFYKHKIVNDDALKYLRDENKIDKSCKVE